MQAQPTKKNQPQIELDSENNPLMTTGTIRFYCLADGLPERPQLNEKLYLYEKGFKKILPLNLYQNLTSLWLNSNKIAKIQNLQGLRRLVCLYLNDNLIEKIEGVQSLKDLQILNLQKNKITKIQNLLSNCKLQNLNLSSNLLSDSASVNELEKMPTIRTLDLSKNQIENSTQNYQIIRGLKNLTNLNLKSTPFARGLMNYRKNMIAILSNLKFFDDRPVLETEHRIFEAWLDGGLQKQKKQRERIMKQQQLQKKRQRNEQIFGQNKSNAPSDVMNYAFTQPSFENQKQAVVKRTQKKLSKIQQSKQNKVQTISTKQHIKQDQEVNLIIEDAKNKKNPVWKKQYELLLQALLEKHQFDFSEVQPRFNMIINGISKKLSRQINRYEASELEKIWTQVEIRRRSECNV